MSERVSIEERRARLGRDAILPAAVAARLLPGRDQDNLEALRRAGITYLWNGRPVVIWGDVLNLVRGDEGSIETTSMPSVSNGRRPVRAASLPRPARLD